MKMNNVRAKLFHDPRRSPRRKKRKGYGGSGTVGRDLENVAERLHARWRFVVNVVRAGSNDEHLK